jgi:ketosteroid isomerase-like protein
LRSRFVKGSDPLTSGILEGMAADKVELARAFFKAYEEGGPEAAREFVHPDFEMVQLPLHPETGTYGRAAAEQSVEDWRAAFDDFSAKPEELVEIGGQVVVAIRERGRLKDSGVEVDHLYGSLTTIRDGKLLRLEWYDSPDDAHKAAAERSVAAS